MQILQSCCAYITSVCAPNAHQVVWNNVEFVTLLLAETRNCAAQFSCEMVSCANAPYLLVLIWSNSEMTTAD